jgi:hypothetical protein
MVSLDDLRVGDFAVHTDGYIWTAQPYQFNKSMELTGSGMRGLLISIDLDGLDEIRIFLRENGSLVEVHNLISLGMTVGMRSEWEVIARTEE